MNRGAGLFGPHFWPRIPMPQGLELNPPPTVGNAKTARSEKAGDLLPSLVWYWRSQGLGQLIPEQVLNILWQSDSDQTPAPLQ